MHSSGYWLFHCHIEFHAEIGMALIFKVGEHEEMSPIPRNFPRCGNWKAMINQDENNLSDSQNSTISIMTEKEVPKTNDTTVSTMDHLFKLLSQFLREIRMTSSASAPSVTLLVFVTCFLSSVFCVHSL